MTLSQDLPHMYGWLGFDFPDERSKVLLFLKKYDPEISIEGDTNGVATIENNQVHLYHGSTMGEWTPKQYDAAYQAFFDEHKNSLNMQGIDKAQNSEITIATATHFNVRVMIGSFLLLLFLAYVVIKWSKYQ